MSAVSLNCFLLKVSTGSVALYFENLTVSEHPDVFSEHKVKTHLRSVLLTRYKAHTDSQDRALNTSDAFRDVSFFKFLFQRF